MSMQFGSTACVSHYVGDKGMTICEGNAWATRHATATWRPRRSVESVICPICRDGTVMQCMAKNEYHVVYSCEQCRTELMTNEGALIV